MYSSVQPKVYPSDLLPNVNWKNRKYNALVGTPAIHKIQDMEVRPDDVWIVTLPKCGTTWMQELTWLVMNDFDFDLGKSEDLENRSPFLEFDYMFNQNLETCLKPVDDLKSPRLIKSHLPLSLLPTQLWTKKPKVIYVYRNPKDYIVSWYYHASSMGIASEENLNKFALDNITDKTNYDQFPFDHVTDFYALRNEPWVYYTSYERMKSNLPEVIEDICRFLGKTITAEQMQKMVKHLSFEEMKGNPRTNHIKEFEMIRKKHYKPYQHHNFVRKGQVGGYKDELSEECISKLDEWIEKELAPHNITLNELLLMPSKN